MRDHAGLLARQGRPGQPAARHSKTFELMSFYVLLPGSILSDLFYVYLIRDVVKIMDKALIPTYVI